VLIVYVMNFTIFNAGWFTFTPIADVVTCYYNVLTFGTNSLTLVAMVVYIIESVDSTSNKKHLKCNKM